MLFGIFADILNKSKDLDMNTLFRGLMLSLLAVVSLVFTSCNDDEQYDFVFELQGSIVTEPGTVITMPIIARNISSVSVASYPDGWTVESLDITTWTVTIKAPAAYSAEDATVEENGILKLMGYTSAGTSVAATCYLSLLGESIDLTAAPSNSYAIWQKDTRYTIDVTHRGEETTASLTPANVDVLWQSAKDLIKYYSYDAAAGKFTFFIGNEEITDDDDNVIDVRTPDGSAIVAAYDAEGTIIWSWHIWVTGSDVEASAVQTVAGEFMDRNLGAYANSNGSEEHTAIHESYGYYYQWGRKDPFNRPYTYDMANNSDKSGYDNKGNVKRLRIVNVADEGVGSIEYSLQNPTVLILGNEDSGWDWLAESDAELWSGDKKSIYDPCPRGWRVPTAEQLAMLDIDAAEDALPSAEVKDKWGWYVSDVNGAKLFMVGAGRRSYETGVFTNMNNYEGATPLPWVGYYWSAEAVAGAPTAYSLFFDLNTTRAVNNRYDAHKAMYRGNAMQVRCVRE